MLNWKLSRKGLVLYFVIVTALIVFIFAGLVLNIMSSQNKLTRHKVSHIQAFYTAQAAVNYAIEKFRMGNDPLWPASGTYTRTMCNIGCDVVEPFLPGVIQSVVIVVSDVGTGPENTRQIKATVIYK